MSTNFLTNFSFNAPYNSLTSINCVPKKINFTRTNIPEQLLFSCKFNMTQSFYKYKDKLSDLPNLHSLLQQCILLSIKHNSFSCLDICVSLYLQYVDYQKKYPFHTKQIIREIVFSTYGWKSFDICLSYDIPFTEQNMICYLSYVNQCLEHGSMFQSIQNHTKSDSKSDLKNTKIVLPVDCYKPSCVIYLLDCLNIFFIDQDILNRNLYLFNNIQICLKTYFNQ
jgi:hypothetical protein